MNMDRLRHQDATKLARELAAPCHRIIIAAPLLRGLYRRYEVLAGKARLNDVPDLGDAVAEPVLKHWHHATLRRLGGRDHPVSKLKRAGQRLLAHDMLASFESGQDHLVVQRRRRANGYDVDVRPPDDLVKAGQGI